MVERTPGHVAGDVNPPKKTSPHWALRMEEDGREAPQDAALLGSNPKCGHGTLSWLRGHQDTCPVKSTLKHVSSLDTEVGEGWLRRWRRMVEMVEEVEE